MAKNTLFNFIRYYLAHSPTFSFPNCTKLTLDTNQEGRHYYRFDLQIPREVFFSDKAHAYELTNHHISVYETENNNDCSLSSSHFTFYLCDEKKAEYRVHVYFDAQGALTQAPIFSVYKEETERYYPIPSEELNEEFIEFARTYADPIIGELRNQLSKKIKSLEESYRTLEKRASDLSKQLDDNLGEYVLALDKIQKTLSLLCPLVRHDYYDNIAIFIKRLKINIEQLTERNAIKQVPHKKEPSNEGPSASITQISMFPSKRQARRNQSRRKERATSSMELGKELELLSAFFEQRNEQSTEEQVRILNESYERINEISLLLDATTKTRLFKDLKNLKLLHGEILLAGENLLKHLINTAKYDLAGQLRGFHHLLNEQFFCKALKSRNHALLDFLLIHGDFRINNQPVKIGEKLYSSAVHYCFSHNSKNTAMVNCLSVLIKHGASVLVKDDKGLSLAQAVISNEEHPLRPAFTANKEQTLDSIPFYKQLRASLNCYLKANNSEEKEKAAIDRCIAVCSLAIERQISHRGYAEATIQNIKEKGEALRKKHLVGNLKEIKANLLEDKDILSSYLTLQKAYNAYKKRLPKSKFKEEANNRLEGLEALDKLLTNVAKELAQDNQFKTLKREAIKLINEKTDFYHSSRRLLEVEKSLQTTRGKGHIKKLLIEQRELMTQVTEYHKRHDPACTLEELAQSEKEIKQAKVLMNSLAQMQEDIAKLSKSLADINNFAQLFFAQSNTPSQENSMPNATEDRFEELDSSEEAKEAEYRTTLFTL